MATLQEQNKALMLDFLARLDAGDRDVIEDVYSRDVVFHFPGSPDMGFEDILAMVETVYTAFPDFTHTVDDILAEGDKVIVRVTDSGTHLDEFEGAAPTGKKVSFGAIAIMQIHDGKIVEVWEEIDWFGLLKQIGALPELASAGA
jgi:steroid delta-isomerase-like uncharacterized protein